MYKLIILFSMLIFVACNQGKSVELNQTDDELVAILQDIHIANTVLLKYRANERDSVSQLLRLQIAEIHGVSVEGLDYMMEQIQLTPARYLDLEKKAVESLKQMKDSLKLSPTNEATE